jgi:hypothetical protein
VFDDNRCSSRGRPFAASTNARHESTARCHLQHYDLVTNLFADERTSKIAPGKTRARSSSLTRRRVGTNAHPQARDIRVINPIAEAQIESRSL